MKIIFDPASTIGEFTADGLRGWAWAYAAERGERDGERRKCKKVVVTWSGEGGAWREVTVRGTLARRRAVQAALPHALPTPIVRVEGAGGSKVERFGDYVEICI